MKNRVLALDYDGTLAADGRVDDATVAALSRFRDAGGILVMVTGREIDDLRQVCPHLHLFEMIVAENGALLVRPETGEEEPLGPPPPRELIDSLRRRGVQGLSWGRVILATWRPHEIEAVEAIEELGLEHQIIFNKGAVMILPPGINKATGLAAALERLGLEASETVGVGDAENDHSFLKACGASAAVANAIESLKSQVDYVAKGDHGRGVVEVIERMMSEGPDPVAG